MNSAYQKSLKSFHWPLSTVGQTHGAGVTTYVRNAKWGFDCPNCGFDCWKVLGPRSLQILSNRVYLLSSKIKISWLSGALILIEARAKRLSCSDHFAQVEPHFGRPNSFWMVADTLYSKSLSAQHLIVRLLCVSVSTRSWASGQPAVPKNDVTG